MRADNLARLRRDVYTELDAAITDAAPDVAWPAARRKVRRPLIRAIAEAGWNGVLLEPGEHGLGLGHVAFAEAARRLGAADVMTALAHVMHVSATRAIARFGSDAQKLRWLNPNLLGGLSTSEGASDGHWWFNLSEAGRDGADYILNATKSFVTSGDEADFYLMQTRTPGAQDPADVTFFIVGRDTPRLEVGSKEQSDPNGGHYVQLRYLNVRAGHELRLGREGDGRDIIYDAVSPVYLLGLGAVWEGLARASLEDAARHASNFARRDFSMGLAEYKASRQLLGDAKVLVETLAPWRNELSDTLDALASAGRPLREALVPLTEFRIHAAEVANRVASIALTVTGGSGYGRTVSEHRYRSARLAQVMSPSIVLAREWIGKAVLGMPLEII